MHFLKHKYIATLTLFAVFASPLSLFAQTGNTSNPPRAIVIDENTYRPANVQSNSQAYGQTGNQQFGLNSGAVSSSFASCLGSSAITNIVKNQISTVLSSSLDVFRVPINSPIEEAKESGSLATAGLSWDQMGWCLANSLVEAISASTVNWINSGFQGNPAFVDDPGQFFGDIADIQAGAFLNEITSGLACTPIQDLVRINIASSYNSSISPYGERAACTFSGISGNLEQFMAGESFSWQDWISYTQNPYNNPYGATVYSEIELAQRIRANVDIQSQILDWGSGFLSKKDENGKIVSPGKVIENQVNERLFSGQRRLEIADEFNEVVEALVGQLIKMAVSEMTQQ